MPDRRIKSKLIAGTIVAVATVLGVSTFGAGRMQEIKFDLGKNIIDTARASGVPSFSTRNVDGIISYSVNAIPAEIPAHYTRSGYEISWQPVFAFTMYADEKRNPSREVETVNLQLDRKFDSHAQAQLFVEQTIAQFKKGKWKRYYNPTWETLLTGRSSFLDENGKIESSSVTIDPDFHVSPADWQALVRLGASWRWVGDGVLAVMHVTGTQREGDAKPDYDIDLDFDLLDVKLKRDAANEAESNKKGDAKGWNSTAEYEQNKVKQLAILKLLEANAIKRGDSVVVPH